MAGVALSMDWAFDVHEKQLVVWLAGRFLSWGIDGYCEVQAHWDDAPAWKDWMLCWCLEQDHVHINDLTYAECFPELDSVYICIYMFICVCVYVCMCVCWFDYRSFPVIFTSQYISFLHLHSDVLVNVIITVVISNVLIVKSDVRWCTSVQNVFNLIVAPVCVGRNHIVGRFECQPRP